MTETMDSFSAGAPGVEGAAPVEDGSRLGASGVLSILAVWMCVPVLVGAFFLLLADGVPFQATARIVAVALVFSLAWTVVTAIVLRLTTRLGLEEVSRSQRVAFLAAAGVVLALLVGTVMGVALGLSGLRPPGQAAAPTLGEAAARMLVPNLLIYFAIVGIGLARDASRRARLQREESVRLRAQLAEARLRVLHTQLNPHFLFNTLNAVSGLMEEDPRGARRMIARLSELLRYALREGTAAEIPLDEELKLVGRYLEIVEIRYQGCLRTSVVADDELRQALVPSLVLQPLAENAMIHGVGKAGGEGRIEVHAARSGDRLVLRVLDTGAGDGLPAHPASPAEGGGLGLRHTRERLRELYGEDQRFVLQPSPEGGMVATIELPYHTAPWARPAS